jgi:nitroimidazol reductase NimA-like FMN-containing flavoprotein (pyridoxamine 5'-phosphate oxidase superfamily)
MRRRDREISDIHELEEIINKADACRIALANDNLPYIVTMNFGYVNYPQKMLFFHCASEGKKLDMLRKNNHVCFAMDTGHEIVEGKNGCDWGAKFTSIVGYGHVDIITEKADKINGLTSIMKHYGGDKEYEFDNDVVERTTVLKLTITEITGKKKI